MNLTYRHTIYASYIGYITQAIIVNFAPLLFLTFQTVYHIPISQITVLVTVYFLVQLLVDLFSIRSIDRIGYRKCIVAAHVLSAIGLISLPYLPILFYNAFWGLLAAVVCYAIGGGLLEVLLSLIVEACPTPNKPAAMSLLHSFYCWGHAFVVILSTLYFLFIGIEHWKWLSLFWALIPLGNAYFYTKVPIAKLTEDGHGMPLANLLKHKLIWVCMLLMVCAGASEQAIAQWSSAFAEAGLGISKTIGDLMGPCLFALLMGVARLWFSKRGAQLRLIPSMMYSSILCVMGYLIASLSPWAFLALVGCGICGLSVGILWPASLSLTVRSLPSGGTPMFAILAFSGSLGCSAGPMLVGLAASESAERLPLGILAATVFPFLSLIGLFLYLFFHKRSCVQKT